MHTSHLWNIYCESFPESERRSLEQQKEIQGNPYYRLDPITHESKPVGFMAWWDLPDCYFIEHIAIDASCRSYGLGGKFLGAFIEKATKSVILEVEPPTDELTSRRIGFYERLGLKLNPYLYYQPSFKNDGHHVQLMVMSWPNALDQNQFNHIAESLYTHVYNRPGHPDDTLAILKDELAQI